METLTYPADRQWANFLSGIGISRRWVLMAFTFALMVTEYPPLKAQRLSRDYDVDILVNHAGYRPGATKTCIAPGTRDGGFEVIQVATNKVVYSGIFKPASGDFGDYSIADFTPVSDEGVYYILSDTLRSVPFTLSDEVYKPAMNLILSYFSRQRCGGSTTGYLTPCHLDDGVRMDNGKHQDVTGGWHDASDLRKWVSATIYGMIGMAKVYELYPDLGTEKLLDELRWGNHYFLSMQEPNGSVMSYVGGDVQKHSDSNRWTDNQTGEEDGELGFTQPNSGRSTADMLIIGSKDDRVIKTDPLGIMGQYNFVTAEAMVARIARDNDPSYAKKCLEAATKCFNWCQTWEEPLDPRTIGASIQAGLELYKTTKQETYSDFAIAQARKLINYQDLQVKNEVSGFFYNSPQKEEPYKNIWNGCMEFYALCDLAEMHPDHPDVGTWKNTIASYARNYLSFFAAKNSFALTPLGLFKEEDPGGNRKAASFWYRYFMQPEMDWWVGVNSNLASNGIGLWKASRVLGDPVLKAYAQRQLDWIIGVNPFNSSTLIGVGHNHPKHFPGSTFYPQTPVIHGAVMNGLGGDHNDQPAIGNGGWQISEYWTPMVAHTLWLMAELSAEH